MAEPEEIHTISPSPRAKQTARVKSNIGKIKFEKNEFESAYSFYMDAGAVNDFLVMRTLPGTTATVRNISVKEVIL